MNNLAQLHQFKQQLHKMEYPWYNSTTTTYLIQQQQLHLDMNSTTIQQHNITIHQFEKNSQSTHLYMS